jgi:hypothetical protein
MGWPDCVVVFIDIPDLKKKAARPDSSGSQLMRAFHKVVAQAVVPGSLPSLDHVYAWNDSALLLAYVDGTRLADEKCLRDAHRLKLKIDDWMRTWSKKRSYAIAVKGQTFPEPTHGQLTDRVTILRTSSYAMGNCFEIERKVKDRKLRKSWYLDDRLAKQITGRQERETLSLKLLPRNRECKVHFVEGDLFQEV